MKLYEDGLIKSLRYKSFEAKNITDAFRFMQKGQHIGKVVVALPEDTSSLPSTPAPPTVSFNSAATYLLVGGLGGLGRSLATWMVENGAKTLVFLSRSAASAEHEPFINELRSQGCIAITVAGSVTEMGDVMKAIHSAPSIIAGVVNLSAVIHVCDRSQQHLHDTNATLYRTTLFPPLATKTGLRFLHQRSLEHITYTKPLATPRLTSFSSLDRSQPFMDNLVRQPTLLPTPSWMHLCSIDMARVFHALSLI